MRKMMVVVTSLDTESLQAGSGLAARSGRGKESGGGWMPS